MKVQSRLRRASAALLSLLMVLPSAATNAQMASAVNFRVTEGGAASYEIPVRVPPGIMGMQPKLAVAYNSQGGNGIVGKGWGLAGLSSIVRCARTLAQDGVKGAVMNNANDRFCLDGQRLIAISGVYGAAGTEYRTERDNFARILSFGVAGAGPAWFQVTTKSGQIIEYGNTADSRAEAQGSTSVRVYAVNKIADRDGNYMNVTYVEDTLNGDQYPSRIDYTGNAGAPPATPAIVPGQSVRFVYQTRPDIVAVYQAGSRVTNTVRLSNVQTYVGATLVSDYRIAYQTSPETGRSRITSVTECPPSPAACLPPVTVSWSAPSVGFGGEASWGTPALLPNPGSKGSRVYDVNGDGLPDFIYDDSARAVHVMLSTGSSFQADASWGTRALDFNPNGPGIRFADVNRDGLMDLVYHGTSGTGPGVVRVMLSTGAAFTADTQWGTLLEAYNTQDSGRLMVIDLNGDDLPDVIYDGTSGMRVMLNSGTAFPTDTNWGSRAVAYAANSGGFQIADMNGDGLPDVVYDSDTGIRVKINNGVNGFAADAIWGTRATGTAYTASAPGFQLADVNGDGLLDIVYDSTSPLNTIRVLLNKGNGFEPDAVWATRVGSYTATTPGLRVDDVNGDGLADIIYQATDGIRVLLSTGAGFGPDTVRGTLVDSVSTADSSRMSVVDVGGDGRGDVVYLGTASPAAIRVLPTSGGVPDLAVSLSNGLGATVSITHKPLTDSTVYTKETSATYPLRDIRVPIPVVSSTSTSNGIGGTYSTAYFYTGAKLDMRGRGMLGFHVVQSTDPQGLKSLTTFRQDWPYTGLASQTKRTRADNGVLTQVDNTLTCKDFDADPDVCTVVAGKRYFPYVSQSDEQTFDLNGAFVGKKRITNTFDIFGNVTQTVATTLNADNTASGFSKTTTNTYSNDATKWLLGKLTRATVTSTTP